MEGQPLPAQLTRAEKASLCRGSGSWPTQGIDHATLDRHLIRLGTGG